MVYSPLAPLPAADHEYGPIKLGRLAAAISESDAPPGKYAVRILKADGRSDAMMIGQRFASS